MLTLKKVAKLLRGGTAGRHFDGNGLYLVVSGRNTGNWSRRYEKDSRGHWLGLGPTAAFKLLEARERNRRISQQLADHVDPLAQRRTERAQSKAAAAVVRTFKEAAEEYFGDHQAEWRSAKHGRLWLQSLVRYAYPKLGALNVADITKTHVLAVLEQSVPAADGSTGKFWAVHGVTADRVRGRIEMVLAAAVARGYRPEGGTNPAAWAQLEHVLAKPKKAPRHFAAVPYAEVPELFAALGQRQGFSARDALLFTILTGARTGEVLGAQWREIDLDAATWAIAADRMKSGRRHEVPLSSQAVELLRSLPVVAGNPHVFVGPYSGGALSDSGLRDVLRAVGRSESIHGFRSAFSDWAHERSGFSNHSIEISLAHSVGSAVEKAYRRGSMLETRRKLMQAWSDFVTTPPKAAIGANVVAMRGQP